MRTRRKDARDGWWRGDVRGIGGRGGFVSSWTPAALAPYAQYDGHVSGTSALITDTSGNARANMTLGAAAAAPAWLDYGTTPFLWLPGVAYNWASTGSVPHTGDSEWVMRARATDWTPASNCQLFGRYGVYSENGLPGRIALLSTGELRFDGWIGGGAQFGASSTAATGIADDTMAWIRVTRAVSSGDLKFYTCADQATEPTGGQWVQLGTTVSTTAGALAAGTVGIEIGASQGGSGELFVGRVARAILRNNGATVADFDASLCTQTGYTDSYGNVWAIGRTTSGRKTVASSPTANSATSKYVTTTDDYFTGPAAAVPPATAGASCSMWAVVRPWATQVANDVVFTTRSGAGAGVTLRLASATTMVADVSDGTTTVTTPAVTFTPGQRLVAGVILAGGAPGTARVFINSTLGSTVARNGTTETGGALYCCSNSTPANFAALEVRVPYMATASALDQGSIVNLTAYYGGGL